MKRNTLIFLAMILLLASTVRFFRITTNPQSLYWEEVALGYDAYSILKTGKDYHGNSFPVVSFPSFGDYKPSLYFYAMVPFLAVLGPTTLAVRFPSALAGVLTVLVVYGIGKRLRDEKLGLVAALFFAIQPWSIQISRAGFETNLATLLVALGVYFLVSVRAKPIYMIWGAISFSLSMYAYHAERLISPLLGSWIAYTQLLKKNLVWMVGAGVCAVVMLLPLLTSITNPEVTQRAAETSIFAGTAIVEQSNLLKELDKNQVVGKYIHHRFVVSAQLFVRQYLKNFSPRYLFLEGDGNPRHGTALFGPLYYWEFVTLLCGVFVLCTMKKDRHAANVLIAWILLAAIAPAVTLTSPHTLRFLAAAPAFSLISSYGAEALFEWVSKKYRPYFLMFAGAVIVVHMVLFMHALFVIYPLTSAREWQYGYKELVESVEQLRKPDQEVFVTREQGRPSMYFLWYTQQDPIEIQKQNATLKKDQLELLEFGPYHFGDSLPSNGSYLFATSPAMTPPNVKILKTITLPTHEVMWNLWERS